MKPARCLAGGEPAGRGPRAAWYLSHFHARSSSKRSTRFAAVAATGALVGRGGAGFGGALEPPQAASATAQVRASIVVLVVGGHRLEQVREARAGRLAAGRNVLG